MLYHISGIVFNKFIILKVVSSLSDGYHFFRYRNEYSCILSLTKLLKKKEFVKINLIILTNSSKLNIRIYILLLFKKNILMFACLITR